jgi:tetratricopeptide (TPR) repeat protein
MRDPGPTHPFARSLMACLFALSYASVAQAQAGPANPAPERVGNERIVVEGRREERRSGWKRAESEHLMMFSDGGEAELKRAANDVERLHRLMVRLYGPDMQAGETAKLKIILVDSVSAYRGMTLRNLRSEEGPFAPSFAQQRYYDPRADGAVLVVPRADQIIDLDTAKARDADCDDMAADEQLCGDVTTRPAPVGRPWESVLFSAYAQHFILNHLPAGYPRWYLDGIGALFSTARIRRDGSLDYAKLSLVNRQIFRSYGRLNAGDVLTGRYLEAPSRQMEWTPFHAALLVHFFVYSDLKPERRAQFQQYMTAIHQGTPMADAAQVFGDMRKLQSEISAYAGRDSLDFARTEPPELPMDDPSITVLSPASAAMIEASVELESRLAANSARADADGWLAEVRREAEKFPRDADAMLVLAEAECRSSRYAACLEAAGQALEASPDDIRALSWKGLALAGEAAVKQGGARSDDLKAARATIARAIGLDGEMPLPRIAYFQSFTLAGEAAPDDAMAGMAKVVRMVPAAPAPRLSLGAELIRRGQPDLARKLLYPVLFGPYDSPERKQAEAMLAAQGTAPNPG